MPLEHGAGMQVPPAQYGLPPSQRLPHVPQFIGSFIGFTQPPSQHIRPVMHAALQTRDPPVPVTPPVPVMPPVPATLPPVPLPPVPATLPPVPLPPVPALLPPVPAALLPPVPAPAPPVPPAFAPPDPEPESMLSADRSTLQLASPSHATVIARTDARRAWLVMVASKAETGPTAEARDGPWAARRVRRTASKI